jgi:hypothetical protein
LVPGDHTVTAGELRDLLVPDRMVSTQAVAEDDRIAFSAAFVVDLVIVARDESRGVFDDGIPFIDLILSGGWS